MAMESKATVNWESFLGDVEDYFDGTSQDNWRKIFIPLFRGIVTDQVNRWSTTLGMRWNVQNLFARDWFNRYVLKFAQEIGTTTKEAIGGVINQGIKEGWSIPTMQNHLTDFFGHMAQNDPLNLEWYLERMPPYRSEMIARTETIRASNAGTTEQFKEWNVRQHEWLSTKDDRTRPDHVEADKQVVNVGEPFSVGGEELEYPGDPSGSPENTINCRCTTIPVVEGMND